VQARPQATVRLAWTHRSAGLDHLFHVTPHGKALSYFEVAKFGIELTPATIAKPAASLPVPGSTDESE
jgi:hypothetical protein